MKLSQPFLLLVALGIVASYWLLEGAFTRADQRKAQRYIRQHRNQKETLEQFLLSRHPERTGPITCRSRIVSSCRGYVRVTCTIPLVRSSVEYRFDVDLPTHVVHPADETAKRVLKEFGGPSLP